MKKTRSLKDSISMATITADELLLSELAKCDSYTIRAAVAGNPNTSIETLKKLSKDNMFQVKAIVAGNERTPQDVILKLSRSQDWSILRNIAFNKKAPSKALRMCVSNRAAISWVLVNPNADSSTMSYILTFMMMEKILGINN